MTEQEWLELTLTPAQREFPRAVSRQRAIYQGWIKTMSREPGEYKDERTKEQKEEQQKQKEYQCGQGEKYLDKYWKNGPS